MKSGLEAYLAELGVACRSGEATERSHYPALKKLIEAQVEGGVATIEPKWIACGAPDFRVRRSSVTVGYVEAKDVGLSLDKALKTDQLKRYRASLPNLIVTNYLV
ncbi:MAG TPA: hypothetical protein VIP09_15745, partial [Dehalococcoidia bacterium]|jgi:hypothetical protein